MKARQLRAEVTALPSPVELVSRIEDVAGIGR
jgi:hypothetical protein